MNQHTDLLAEYAAALTWWGEAGVDLDFVDEPASWLRAAAPPTPVQEAPPPPPPRERNALERALSSVSDAPIGGDRAGWPTDLAAFREYWLHEPSLDHGGLGERVAPRGEAGVGIMMLVGQPDPQDRQVLLSGEQGRVLDAFARAAGLSENRIYVASALPRPTALPDWNALGLRGLGDLLRLHVELAAPRRLLVFGRTLAPLLGATPETREVDGRPLLVAPSLESIDRSPARKKRFWNQWLEWSS
ncbi:hypothetical protein [Qipengyuania sp. MTN3-11]|uniref:hypothetical protein n=1 Tax=Qipengyuania sp. MTN3-11 TaxID=3056557 RepID=UPI0036F1B2C3